MDIAGQVAVVTGAGIGTGRAIALALVAAGADVVVSDVDATPAQWGAVLDLILRAPMLATQLALAPMQRAGGGAVVNVASTAGLGSEPYGSPGVRRRQGRAHPLHLCTRGGRWRARQLHRPRLGRHRARHGRGASHHAAADPLDTVADAVLTLIRDDTLAGRALVLLRGGASRIE